MVRGGAQPLSRGGRPAAALGRYTEARHRRNICVAVRALRLGRTSFKMEYARDGLVASGRASLILIVNASGEKTPLGRELSTAIRTLDPDCEDGAGP